MQTLTKKNSGILFGVLVLFAMLVLFVCLPQTAHAAIDSTVTPHIYCTYTDSNGDPADGNNLSANETYQVSFMLQGVSAISTLELTASIAEETDAQTGDPVALATVASTPVAGSLLSDTHNDITSMGYVLGNGNIVFGFVSDNANSSTVSSEGVLLATISVTFADDCDAEDVIIPSINPNMTFVQTDYSDGYLDSYALVDTFEDYTGTLYPMTIDVSPVLDSGTVNVSAKLVVARDSAGENNGTGVTGNYTVTIYDSNDDVYATQTFAMGTGDGQSSVFSFDLPAGSYTAKIESQYAKTRDDISITVSGSDDIVGPDIPIICCDFNCDTKFTAMDAVQLYEAAATSSTDKAFDLNCDSKITALDAVNLYAISSSAITLAPVEIAASE